MEELKRRKEGKSECEKSRKWRGEEERQNEEKKRNEGGKGKKDLTMLNQQRMKREKSNRCMKSINTGLV